MKIIFHFGAHKTASTHLQFNLALNREYLRQNGIAYFRFQEIEGLQDLVDNLAANINNSKFDLENSKNEIKEIIENQIQGFQTAIITYEGCLGYHNHLDFQDIYPFAEQIIPVYQEILKHHEVIPVYAVRNYDEYLVSTYQQELGHGIMNSTLDKYFSNKRLTFRRWSQIVELLNESFSNETKVFGFDEYKIHWKNITLEIIRLADKNLDENKLKFEIAPKNSSKSNFLLQFNYSLNRLFLKIPEFGYKKALYYRTIKHISPLFDSKTASKVLRNYQKSELPILVSKEEFEKEFSALKKRFGLLG